MTWDFPVASPLALKGIRWIEERIGKARYLGWSQRADPRARGADMFAVGLLRLDQVVEEFTGKTLEDALKKACEFVKREKEAARAA